MKKWTEYEVRLLIENYYENSANIPELLKTRTKNSIFHKACVLKLKAKNDTRKTLVNKGIDYRFKKGQNAWNKGKKVGCFSPETCFQKGNVPHTAKYFEKPYLNTRIHKGILTKEWFIHIFGKKRMNYLTYLWNKNHGLIPKGYTPMLKKDFDVTKEPTINDIILISRAEQINIVTGRKDLADSYCIRMLKRSGITEITAEMIEIKRAQLMIKRQINEKIK
jgi:hypothetical protein